MKKRRNLTPQQVRFCHEYLVSSNTGSAALQAGYSARCAHAIGSNLLAKPGIQAYLGELRAEQREKYKPTMERVLSELSLMAFADVTDYVNWGNNVRELKMMPENKRRALSEITIIHNGKAGQVRLKLHDKIRALRLLGEHFGVFEKQVQITASQTKTISIHAPVSQKEMPSLGEMTSL